MTYKGAIKQLYEMRDNIWMPEFFKPYFDKIIETLTDDVRENVRGEWIFHKSTIEGTDDSRECSVCGVWFNWTMPRNSFCPNCGADMRREDNGRDEENHNRV